jgi:hypothetical protein
MYGGAGLLHRLLLAVNNHSGTADVALRLG